VRYDCIVLLSGGKDSTYMLYQLVGMGLRPLAFTLDNGYISDEAKANIRRVVNGLGVAHIFGHTPAMNAIFVDSLKQHANVCNGCFKTIYTLATNLARERGIQHIVTGLSRGQFFETRLSEAVFTTPDFDADAIDQAILAARKAYHRRDDVISRSLDVDVFRNDQTFDDVQFVDFYRYCTVSLEEMYAFLKEHAPWVRPSDTGRSTNCLINDAGIWVHKRKRGFHNYALPYAWDVRLGHKTRDAALDELNDEIDEARVRCILREIGYDEPLDADANVGAARLAAYYVADNDGSTTASDLRAFLAHDLPDYMLPSHFIRLDKMPLTPNGKVDRKALPQPGEQRPDLHTHYAEPRNETEARIARIWQDALRLSRVGVHDNFFEIGGSSLPALQVVTQVNRAFQVELPIAAFFEKPTVAGMSEAVEAALVAELAALSDEEVERLLARS
jgi:acyl carrier protein